MNPPEVSIRSGSPTDVEVAAIAVAVEALWREEAARAAASGSSEERNPWILAARAEATGRARDLLRGSWRRSGRFAGPETDIHIGRGDAR